jgi:hypothetical protein
VAEVNVDEAPGDALEKVDRYIRGAMASARC